MAYSLMLNDEWYQEHIAKPREKERKSKLTPEERFKEAEEFFARLGGE